MKKLLIISLIVILLILGGYFGMGVITERTLKKNIALMEQSNGFVANVTQYNRSLFTSKALINVTLTIPPRVVVNAQGRRVPLPARTYTIEMPLTIKHGPLMFTSHGILLGLGYASTNLTLPAEYKLQFSKAYTKDSTKPHIQLNAFVTFLNKMHVNLKIPAFHLYAINGHHKFDWLGLNSNITVSRKANNIVGSLQLDGIQLMQDHMHATVAAISSNYNLQQNYKGLYTGTAHFILPAVNVTTNNVQQFAIKQFVFDSSSDIINTLFKSQLKASLQQLFLQGRNFGPGKALIKLSNLDTDALVVLNEKITAMQQAPEQDRQRLFYHLLPEVPALLNKGAELIVPTLQLTTPEGDFNSSLLLKTPNNNSTNPFQMLQQAIGHLTINTTPNVVKSIVKAALQHPLAIAVQQVDEKRDLALEVDEKIASMVKSKVLVQKDGNYILDLQWLDGHLTLNGHPFNSAIFGY